MWSLTTEEAEGEHHIYTDSESDSEICRLPRQTAMVQVAVCHRNVNPTPSCEIQSHILGLVKWRLSTQPGCTST
jgi:hypothetical protein